MKQMSKVKKWSLLEAQKQDQLDAAFIEWVKRTDRLSRAGWTKAGQLLVQLAPRKLRELAILSDIDGIREWMVWSKRPISTEEIELLTLVRQQHSTFCCALLSGLRRTLRLERYDDLEDDGNETLQAH